MDNYEQMSFIDISKEVNHPQHYQGISIEVIDVIKEFLDDSCSPIEAFCMGNVIKYILRYRKKGGISDLKKAEWYLDYILNSME